MTFTGYLSRKEVSKTDFAQKLGVARQYMYRLAAMEKCPAEWVVRIEDATGGEVSRHEMRPDLWPQPSEAA